MHECDKDERIRALEERVTKVETKVDSIKEDLKEIKSFQGKLMFWIIGTLASSMITLLVLIFNLIK